MKLYEYFSNSTKWHQKANFRDAEGEKLEITYGTLDHEFRLNDKEKEERKKKGEQIPINRELVVSCCLWGAIQYCYEGFNNQNLIVLKLNNALQIQEGVYSLVLWNDDPGRKFEDIKSLVDKCGV